ncbi:hypothetical protein DPMN_096721 [Dreissena polymorpha]|uniref:Uncharacterized protein n=1 Tax=Dreissena polymorpha TaxID=45954 RepID=A0A9D4L993_DREPO|nr:hypothetical protein DPMN_096721 [Dreissena polymorpha]
MRNKEIDKRFPEFGSRSVNEKRGVSKLYVFLFKYLGTNKMSNSNTLTSTMAKVIDLNV